MSRTTSRPLSRYVALAAAALVALTGCLSMPTEGGVQNGIEAPPADEGLDLVAPGPADDAEPTEIVQGFVFAAAAGLSDDFSVAREFMTTAGSSQWQPRGSVTVYSDTESLQYEVDPNDPSVVTVTAEVTATVDERGTYTEAPPGTEREFTFELVQIVGDQWRISRLDGGVLMSGVTFGSQYRQMSVYFLSADSEWRLVPEARWVPRSGSDRAAVRALLAGPSEWLAPAVVTAFPDGTQLALDAVELQGNVASVALSPEMLGASVTDRALALEQLRATLGQLPQVRDVEITVSGNPLPVEPDEVEVLSAPVVDRVPTVLADGVLARVASGTTTPVDGVAQPEDLAHVALPYDDGPALGLIGSSALVTLATPQEDAINLLELGSRLLPPSYDVQGWAWTGTAGPGNDGTLQAVDPHTGDNVAVAAPDLAGADVIALRISREGARIAYALRTDESVRVYVAAIVRDQSGRPQSIAAGQPVGAALTQARDIVWVDEVELGVLGSEDSEPITVLLMGVGGQTATLPSIDGATALACGNGRRELYVATQAGDLFGRSGNGWRQVTSDISDPTFSGELRRRALTAGSRGRTRCDGVLSTGASRWWRSEGEVGHAARVGRRAVAEELDALVRAAVELALPRECAGCGRPERGLCRACLRTFGDPVRCEESTQHLAGAGGDAALPTWALADYAGAARHAVLAWKSGGRPDLAAPLTALIARAATAVAAEVGALGVRDRLAVVPAPSGAARRRSGRFVVGELADAAGAGLAATLGIEVLVIDPLRRRASTDHLLGAAARRDDRAGSVRCLTALPGLSCLIVDDVVTTGATLAASAGALAGAGAHPVAALVLARTPPPGAAVRDLQPRADGGPVV